VAEGCYFTEDTLAELGIMSTGWGISSPSMVTATGVPSASTLTFGAWWCAQYELAAVPV